MLGLVAIGVGSYQSAKKEAEKIYDAQLAHFAYVLHELNLHEVASGNASPKLIPVQDNAAVTPYKKDFSYRVWLGDTLLLQSDNAQAFGAKAQSAGFADIAIDQHMLRLFVLREGDMLVEVAEDYHARTDLIHQVALSILVPLFFIIPLLLLALWQGLRIGLKPLNQLSAHMASVNPDNLQHVGMDIAVPGELAPFVSSINQLMERVEEVIEREKRFTGYAAHELRTPLAALKTQLQVALRGKDEVVRRQMLSDAVSSIDRMAHLVNQMLLLLRSQRSEQAFVPLDLSQLVADMAGNFESVIAAKGQLLAHNIQPGIQFAGNGDMLRVMLRNLLDNASRYSPDGARITLTLEDGAQGLQMRVHNTGVTLGSEDCAHMFEPFYRGRANISSGAGLGLAIVSWIAKMHHLHVHALPGPDGLTLLCCR
ncbi:MAG: hypothetical protein EBV03_00655 [Proteobacteria bacterium]|nr:hypothetical protein [Pseudomonadota bacterium]